MREHCCAERGGVPIGGGLGGVRCRARDASVARDARAQFQQAAPYASTIQIDHRRQAVRVLIRMYCREQSYASDVRVIYSCTRTTKLLLYSRKRHVQLYSYYIGISTVVRAANYGSGLRATRIYCTRMSYSCTIQLYHMCTS